MYVACIAHVDNQYSTVLSLWSDVAILIYCHMACCNVYFLAEHCVLFFICQLFFACFFLFVSLLSLIHI